MALILLPALLTVALLILSGYGVYVLVTGLFNPAHVLIPVGILLLIVLLFRFASAAIVRWRDRK